VRGAADQRRRPAGTVGDDGAGESLRALPAAAYPAMIRVKRKASRSALVAFEGNHHSVPRHGAGRPSPSTPASASLLMADTLYQQLREHLHHLRLTAVAERLSPALEAAERDKPRYTTFLADLLAAASERRCSPRSSATAPSKPGTASTTPPPPILSPAPQGRPRTRLLHHATFLSITGDRSRMCAHRDAIAALRPAITGEEFS